MTRSPADVLIFAATATCIALGLAYLAHDAFGFPGHIIRRDALEGATFIGLALVSGVLLPRDRDNDRH